MSVTPLFAAVGLWDIVMPLLGIHLKVMVRRCCALKSLCCGRDLKEDARGLAADGRQASVRSRRRRGKTFTLRNVITLLVLLGFLAMLSILYSRLWPRLPT